MNNLNPAPGLTLAAASGTYTGTSAANRAVAHGLGRIPKMVITQQDDGNACCMIITGEAFIQNLTTPGRLSVTDPTATNFYVGNATEYTNSGNLTGKGYHWVAI